MKSTRRQTRIAAIEILPSIVRLALLEPQEGGPLKVVTTSVPWRQESLSLAADDGRLELAAALRQLSSQYRLASAPLHVALSGDFCVTRVVTGLNDAVRRELAELEQRSELYLSLGHGAKATSSAIVNIDARHQRALLAVANDRLLNSVSEAIGRAGLQAATVEPALVSLCRLLGHLGTDRENPTLVVRGDERGVEVGISYGGQLLLDYRPAARHAKEQAGDIIGSHLHRLQRYCERYVRVDSGKLTSVYVSGDPNLVGMVEQGLSKTDLAIKPLAPHEIDPLWQLTSPASAPEFAAAFGAALQGLASSTGALQVNLIDRKHAHARAELIPALARTLWPVAAVLAISMCGVGAIQWERYQLRGLEAQLAELEPQQAEARMLRMKAINDQQEIAHIECIRKRISSPAWNELASNISRCLPEDVWLDDMKVDSQGRLQLVGASFTEDGVFEFVRWLEKLPNLEHVALSGTRPTRLDVGPATQFDVRCDFSGASETKERKNDNG